MTIETISLDGLTIAHEITGQGQPVILLHGWQCRIENMAPVAQRLAPRGYECHVLDLPGFGRSTLPDSAWGVPDYARLVIHYLDALNLKSVNLIGHSFGGRISIVIGADYPDYVNKIVLADSAGVKTPPTAAHKIRGVAFNAVNGVLSLPGMSGLQPKFRAWVRNRYGSDDLKAAGPLEPIFRAVVREDLLPRASTIKASTLLIWGDQDDQSPLWQGQALEKAIPDAGLVVFEGSGHFAYMERIADFVRIVDTFFKGES